jgi:hypothetical protein
VAHVKTDCRKRFSDGEKTAGFVPEPGKTKEEKGKKRIVHLQSLEMKIILFRYIAI